MTGEMKSENSVCERDWHYSPVSRMAMESISGCVLTAVKNARMTLPLESSLVGKSLPRLDGVEKVTGRAVYGLDLRRPRMLVGKILRSRYPHARIVSIDTGRAEALPGVKAVITGKDLPPGYHGQFVKDETLLAVEVVRYLGEFVAAVAAVDEDTAQRALDLIQVDYEELPTVFDPHEAMAAGAPVLHPDLAAYPGSPKVIKGKGNVCCRTTISGGNIEEGFRQADFVLEDTFCTQMIYQGYLEPHAALAEVDGRERITVWTATQGPFLIRSQLAEIFRLPMSWIRVVGVRCGGAYGGKGYSLVAPLCVLLSMKTHRPVRIALTLAEDFLSCHPRHPSTVHLRSGVMKDGTLMARQATVVLDTGAYSGFGPLAISTATSGVLGPYKIPHIKAEGYCVYTNKISCGALRAPGVTQAAFAVESHMDMIAHRLGIDPLDLRLRNALGEGDLSPSGQVYGTIGLKGVLEAIRDYVGRQGPCWPGQAWGVACGQWGVGGTSSSAQVKINEDGTAVLCTGAVDVGTGSDTVLCQIAAQELGLQMEDISIVAGDTDGSPYDTASVGSRVTFSMGNAVRLAAADARQQLVEMAAQVLEGSPRDLEAVGRAVRIKGSPERAVRIADLAAASHLKGGPILGRGSWAAVAPGYDPDLVKGHMYPTRPGDTFCAQAVQVEADQDTGTVRLLRVASAHDVGCVINPQLAEGQVEGSLGFGLGFALSEEVLFEGGRTLNPLLLDYRLPTAVDMPTMIDAVFLEEPKGDGPYGAKGLAEPPHIPTAGAIANAVYNAIGVRLKELPMTPERIRQALREQRESPRQ